MPRKKGPSKDPQTFEVPVAANASVGRARLRIGDGGRIVIPAEMRAAMLVKPGDTVTAEVVDGEFRIISPKVAIRKVQELARKYRKPVVSVVDELIAERRAEAARDEEESRIWREQHHLAARNRK
jgi:AbrB family looped-hinge helix DNA binding protein